MIDRYRIERSYTGPYAGRWVLYRSRYEREIVVAHTKRHRLLIDIAYWTFHKRFTSISVLE